MASGPVWRELFEGAFFNAATDVVHDSRLRAFLDDNTDMGQARIE
jgi:hypothetical protein